jgi:hypothetical protein
MYFEHGKWFADWRDATGRRLRKAFKTKKAAKRYQVKMHGSTVETKKARASRKPRPSRRRGQTLKARRGITPASRRSNTASKSATATSPS